jgi:TPR repeat protein
MSESAEPVNGYCLRGTKHSHSPFTGHCPDAYESGDYATAFQKFKLLAEQGHTSIQYNLGQMYRDGEGVPVNGETAVKWYRLAAEQGMRMLS